MSEKTEARGGLNEELKRRQAEVVSLYRNAVSQPVPIWGDLSVKTPGITAKSRWRFTDMDMEKKVVFEATHCAQLTEGGEPTLSKFECIGRSIEMNESIISTTKSRGGSFCAIHKSISKGEKKKVDFLEIWNQNRRLWVYDVDTKGLHGNIITKGSLAGAEWSSSESMFLFVAEKKILKGESFFCRKPSPETEQGTKFRWEEDWGEQMEGIVCPVVVILKLPKKEETFKEDGSPELHVEVIEMDNVSLGDAVFTPDEKGIVLVGMPNTPYRLGSLFCRNRVQQLYYFEFETKNFTKIGDHHACIFSPRFTSTGNNLVYLQNEVGGPHLKASKLFCMGWPQKTEHLIVPIPEKPKYNEFPGLYITKAPEPLLRNCTSNDGNLLYVESQWHSAAHILQINLITKEIKKITADAVPSSFSQPFLSWQLLSVNSDCIFASCASPTERPILALGRADARNPGRVSWIFSEDVDCNTNKSLSDKIVSPRLPKLSAFKIDLLKIEVNDDSTQYFEAVYVYPKTMKHRLIVMPHGGPHAASSTTYSPFWEFLLNAGFGLLMVNYRGSTGFGEANLRALPGRVGEVDIQDVQMAVTQVKARGLSTQVVLFGASHGGFINAHLVGQYPSDYSACVMLNPVIDLSMLGPSDIPDWYFFEGGCSGTFHHGSLPIDQDLVKLKACSPIAHAHKVTTPCFFFLGTEDRRVDKGHGLKFYKHLLSRGIETRCNMYNDNHGFLKLENEGDMAINSVLWFDRFAKAGSNE